MKRLRKARISVLVYGKGGNVKRVKLGIWGSGRRFGEMSRALMMGEGFKYVLSVPSRERKGGDF